MISTNVGETGDDQTRTITYHDYDVGTGHFQIFSRKHVHFSWEKARVTARLW